MAHSPYFWRSTVFLFGIKPFFLGLFDLIRMLDLVVISVRWSNSRADWFVCCFNLKFLTVDEKNGEKKNCELTIGCVGMGVGLKNWLRKMVIFWMSGRWNGWGLAGLGKLVVWTPWFTTTVYLWHESCCCPEQCLFGQQRRLFVIVQKKTSRQQLSSYLIVRLNSHHTLSAST